MLMNIKCSAVASIAVDLEFDDGSVKHYVIATNDLVDIIYNHNGCRKRIQGKVVKINCIGNDPKSWSLIIDGSGDFESEQVRFSPMAILDMDILYKAEEINTIQTPKDYTGVPFLRIVHNKLQYSRDGVHWTYVSIDRNHVVIKDEEGTVEDTSDFFCDVVDGIKDE